MKNRYWKDNNSNDEITNVDAKVVEEETVVEVESEPEVTEVEEVEMPLPTSNDIYTVNIAKLNVRSNPDIKSNVVRVLIDGEVVNGVKENDEWIKIEDGYVMSKFLN